jgi:PPOX class probable F420-dependent enzyme
MKIGDDARAALEAGRLAHLTTVYPDGRPHTVIVWVGVEGDQLVIGKMTEDVKVRNIRADNRVSVSLEAAGTTHGLANYIVVEGTAEVVPGGGLTLLRRLAKTYIGPEASFLPDATEEGYVIRITPSRIRGNGPWSS